MGRGYRAWALFILFSLLCFIHGGGYVREDGDWLSYEYELYFWLVPFFWFAILSVISNCYIALLIEILFLVSVFSGIEKGIRTVDIHMFFLDCAGVGILVCIFLAYEVFHERKIRCTKSIWKHLSDVYNNDIHCILSVPFRRLRLRCAIRLGGYRMYEERFREYYCRSFCGSGISVKTIDFG